MLEQNARQFLFYQFFLMSFQLFLKLISATNKFFIASCSQLSLSFPLEQNGILSSDCSVF